jgi:four helix bundle protein
MTNGTPAYDLAERTARFGESVVEFCLKLPFTPVTSPLITQFVKSSTSVGANYGEADEAESKADFRHKIALCRKESRETKHWCRMLARALPREKDPIRTLWVEAKQLHLIFCKIVRTTDANLRAAKAVKLQ